MGNESDLLRMLEPVVRPDGVSGSGQRALRQNRDQPIEARSFESILDEARQITNESLSVPPETVAADEFTSAEKRFDTTQSNDPKPSFSPLSGIDRVENDSLRRLMGNQD